MNIAPLKRMMKIPTLTSRLSVLAASDPASRAMAAASSRACTLVKRVPSYSISIYFHQLLKHVHAEWLSIPCSAGRGLL